MGVNLKPSSCAPRSCKTGCSKRKPLDPSDDETSSGLESDDVSKSCLTEEEIQRVVREQLKLVKYDLKKVRKEHTLLKSHLADLVRRCICNTLKEEVVPAICSLLEDTSRRAVKERVDACKFSICSTCKVSVYFNCFGGIDILSSCQAGMAWLRWAD